MTTYWITGASSGIGLALANELSGLGHNLILSARNESKLKEILASLPHPDNARILPFDLIQTDQSGPVTDLAFMFFGSIDTVILNAGLSQRSLVQETNLDVYRSLMDVNYFGNIALTKSILPKFIRTNHGQFVVISSLVGKFGTPYRSGYSAAKHALHGFYDSLRAEMMMDNKNIGVTIICPGFVSTDISFSALGADGSATHVYDDSNANGMDPKDFAKEAIKVIFQRKFEAYIGGKETIGVMVKRLFPGLFAKKIARAKVR